MQHLMPIPSLFFLLISIHFKKTNAASDVTKHPKISTYQLQREISLLWNEYHHIIVLDVLSSRTGQPLSFLHRERLNITLHWFRSLNFQGGFTKDRV